jgi:hypothetical protein
MAEHEDPAGIDAARFNEVAIGASEALQLRREIDRAAMRPTGAVADAGLLHAVEADPVVEQRLDQPVVERIFDGDAGKALEQEHDRRLGDSVGRDQDVAQLAALERHRAIIDARARIGVARPLDADAAEHELAATAPDTKPKGRVPEEAGEGRAKVRGAGHRAVADPDDEVARAQAHRRGRATRHHLADRGAPALLKGGRHDDAELGPARQLGGGGRCEPGKSGRGREKWPVHAAL